MDRVRVAYQHVGESIVRCTVDVLDPALLHHPAELSVVRTVVAKSARALAEAGLRSRGAPEGFTKAVLGALASVDGRRVVASEPLLSRRIEDLGVRNVLDLQLAEFQAFSYTGSMIDIEIHSELKVDDALLFDTKLSQRSEVRFSPRPSVGPDPDDVVRSADIVSPADALETMANLRALPGAFRAGAWGLLLLGAVVVGVNMAVGVHDALGDPWLYRARPIVLAAVGDVFLAAIVWLTVLALLRRYARLELAGVPETIRRRDAIPASSVVKGVTRVPLERAVIRVVAYNLERTRQRGHKGRTSQADCPARAVVLYEKQLSNVPANARIETLLTGPIDFDLMFRTLYPPQRVSRGNGLEVRWKVQLLHPQFVDKEVSGPVECFPWTEFLAGPRTEEPRRTSTEAVAEPRSG